MYIISVKHACAFNFIGATRGMRNPLQSWDKNDTTESYDPITNSMIPTIGPNDLKLAKELAKLGGSHGKFRRQIFVSFDLAAPWLFWKGYATYKVGTTENSTSQMFKMGSALLTQADFAFESWQMEEIAMLETLNRFIQEWWDSGKKKGSSEWRRLMQFIPGAFIYKRTCSTSYEGLANMYRYRKKHRLQEWQDFFTILEKKLPYSKLWTLKEIIV